MKLSTYIYPKNIVKSVGLSAFFYLNVCMHSYANNLDEVNSVIDTLHQSAASADFGRYFSAFSPHGIFIGTDAREVWRVEEFKAYAKPLFDAGKGWTYVPRDRHIYFSTSGDVAWFDELLDNAIYGETRGTGVLEKIDGEWLIAQYHLTIPIPNNLAKEVVREIKANKKR